MPKIMTVNTETGSTYVFEHRADGVYMLRNGKHPLRRDGEAVRVLRFVREPAVGESMVLELPHLSGENGITVRTTSHVTSIAEAEDDQAG